MQKNKIKNNFIFTNLSIIEIKTKMVLTRQPVTFNVQQYVIKTMGVLVQDFDSVVSID